MMLNMLAIRLLFHPFIIRALACCAACLLWIGGEAAFGVAARGDAPETPPKKPVKEADVPPKKPVSNAAKKLRAEWKIADLKLTREGVEEGKFPPDIKTEATAAVEWFLKQQEKLLADVDQSPEAEARVRKQRAKLEGTFNKRMGVIYDNPAMMKELARQLRALRREMEDLSAGAEAMFAKLDAVDLTPAQREKLKPVVQEANASIRKAKSTAGAADDDEANEQVLQITNETRRKVRQQLTREQQEKLEKKLEE